PMPKPIARSKTRKSVAKRFKITARGKVLRSRSSRRHLLSAKNAKRKRHLSKAARVDRTDVARVKVNLPFGYHRWARCAKPQSPRDILKGKRRFSIRQAGLLRDARRS